MEPYQSAYRIHYSTETALNSITDTLYESLDSSYCTQLLLLDLSSDFDTLTTLFVLNSLRNLELKVLLSAG